MKKVAKDEKEEKTKFKDSQMIIESFIFSIKFPIEIFLENIRKLSRKFFSVCRNNSRRNILSKNISTILMQSYHIELLLVIHNRINILIS